MATVSAMMAAGDRPLLRWDLLEAQAPTGERLTVREAVAGVRHDVLIAIDASHRRYILVEIPMHEPGEIAERSTRGLAVQTVVFKSGDGQESRFVEIACLDPQGHAALDTIALEVVAGLESGASIGCVRLIQSVLAKWRLFWSGLSQGLLSRNQQIGLFGELWFLSRWLAPFVGMGRAVEMWRGPVGARNDFETPRLGIEVKATARIDGAHVIHGLEQLLEPAGGSLLLFSLAVREEASAENSLPSVVASTRQLIGEDHLAMSTFDSMLFSSGYDERFVAEYAKYQFRVRGENLYHVKDNFPRLTPSSFLAALPPGVGNIEYELRLDSAGSWLLASNPSDAAKQLKGLLA